MKKLVPLLLATLALGAPATASAAPRDASARLEKALRGRVAGEPVSCIALGQASSSEIIEGTAILYRVGDTIYVNRPRGGAQTLRRDDVLVTRTFDLQLCRPDIVTLVDRFSRFQRGFVSLGDFVPYRRVEAR